MYTEDEEIRLPTLDNFLSQKFPYPNSYVDYPGFRDLYVRKCDVAIIFGQEAKICTRVVTVANVAAEEPGRGSWQKLVVDICSQGWAVYVENVHNGRFATHLEKLGYLRVNQCYGAPNFLYGHEGHLVEMRK